VVRHAVAIDGDIYRSESDTGDRNRAIANLLRNFDVLQGDPDEVLDVNFQQCSILTSCRELAVMATPLAAGGVMGVLPGQLDVMRDLLVEDHAEPGRDIVRQGDAPDGVYFLLAGSASVILVNDDQRVRLATCSPVTAVGEMALLERQPRSATVRADETVHYLVLSMDAFEMLRRDQCDIALTLLENVACELSVKLRQANARIRARSD